MDLCVQYWMSFSSKFSNNCGYLVDVVVDAFLFIQIINFTPLYQPDNTPDVVTR